MRMTGTIPALPVIDINAAVEFYRESLGFDCRHKEKDFAILKRDEVELHLWAARDESWKNRGGDLGRGPVSSGAESFLAGTASCRIEVDQIDDLFREYQESGTLYSSNTTVESTPWGTREFPALDLHRNLLTFYERG